jgi:hypothetical protein
MDIGAIKPTSEKWRKKMITTKVMEISWATMNVYEAMVTILSNISFYILYIYDKLVQYQ